MTDNLQISTVPSTAEIFPCIVIKPALPASFNSVEPTESNVPGKRFHSTSLSSPSSLDKMFR